MPVRKMQNVDGFSRRFRNDGGFWWLGTEIKTFIDLDGRRDRASVLQAVQ